MYSCQLVFLFKAFLMKNRKCSLIVTLWLEKKSNQSYGECLGTNSEKRIVGIHTPHDQILSLQYTIFKKRGYKECVGIKCLLMIYLLKRYSLFSMMILVQYYIFFRFFIIFVLQRSFSWVLNFGEKARLEMHSNYV